MAKLPESRIKKPEPTLKDLPVGETVFIPPYGMKATTEGECFINPEINFEREKNITCTLRATRETGGFRITILAAHKWKLETVPSFFSECWLPTISVVEEFDPELDQARRKKEAQQLLDDIKRLEEKAKRVSNPPPPEESSTLG